MGLEELRQIIGESDRGDWNIISCLDVPSYLSWGPNAFPEPEYNEHLARAAYRPNISLGLAWGIQQLENFQADWVQELDEPLKRPAPLFIADILFNGMLVAREHLVLVDGGRCYLPIPHIGTMRVSRWDHDFAKLLDALGLEHGVGGGVGDPSRSEFDDYFRRAGLEVGD